MKTIILSIILTVSTLYSFGRAVIPEKIENTECYWHCVTGSLNMGPVSLDVRMCCDCCCGSGIHQYCCNITIEFLDQVAEIGDGNYNIDDLEDIINAIVAEDPNLTSSSQVTQIEVNEDAVFNYEGGGGFKVLAGRYSINKNVSGWTINPNTQIF